jgi:hypothetical protein
MNRVIVSLAILLSLTNNCYAKDINSIEEYKKVIKNAEQLVNSTIPNRRSRRHWTRHL